MFPSVTLDFLLSPIVHFQNLMKFGILLKKNITYTLTLKCTKSHIHFRDFTDSDSFTLVKNPCVMYLELS